MLDIAIIGSGPAGLSAGINAKIRNKNVKIFGNSIESSYLYPAERIDNYLGFYDINGKNMLESFGNHAKEMDIEIEVGKVLEVYNMGSHYTLNVNNVFVDTKAIIIATGVPKSRLITGEDAYLGRGVSYCATCDGNLYRGKTIAVLGESEESDEEAHYLSEIVEKVYYIRKRKEEHKLKHENLEIINGNILEICGSEIVEKVILNSGELQVSGVFILRNSIPPVKLVPGLEIEKNSVKVDRHMKTNLPGVFAAGDCTGKPLQVAKAVGEGLVAALSASSYVDEQKN